MIIAEEKMLCERYCSKDGTEWTGTKRTDFRDIEK